MQKVRVVQNSFQFGEVSDSLIMRTDSPVYGASAQRVENMIVTAEGSLKKRYGLKHIYDYSLTYDSAHPAQSHLFKFEFDENEKYVISVENQKVRCFQLETSGAVTLVSTITTDTNGDALPFDQDYLQEYTYAQYGDVMFICHPLFAPRMLIRTSLTSFEITPYTFDQRADNKVTYQPYSKFQSTDVFFDPSATTGTGITVEVYAKGTADDDGIATEQTYSSGSTPSNLTLDGVFASGGTVTLPVARKVTITSDTTNTVTFTITGTNENGIAAQDTSITSVSAGTTVTSTFKFKTITAITASTYYTNIKVGVSEEEYIEYFDVTGTRTGGEFPDSSHKNVVLRYGESEMEIASVQSPSEATVDIVDSLRRRLTVLNPLRTIDGSSTVEVTMLDHGFAGGESITIEDASAVGGINTGSLNGARTVGSIIDENTFTFTAGGSASSAEDGGGYVKIVSHAPTLDWDEQSWSAKRGYPAAIAFHENRLCFAGTLAEPDTVWMSKIGSFFNFDVGEAEDIDSINLVAATGDVNQIRYMVSNRDLQIFTASGELYVPTYLNQAITPTNAQIRKQTPYGSEFVQPASIDGATIFVQTGGRIVREYLYTDSEDAYTSTSISTIASHLIDEPKCMAVVHSGFGLPDSYAAITLGNGDMTLFSSNRAEKRASWTRVTTDGSFCSVVAIHDRLFANIWYNNKLQLCEFDTEVGLDKWVSGTIAANKLDVSQAFSNGDVVKVIDDEDVYIGEFTVDSSDEIDLTGYSGTVYAGLDYTVKVITNPVDASLGSGPATGEIRGITNVVVDVKSTKSMKVNSRPVVSSEFTGKKEVRLLGYNRNPQVTIEQDQPTSMQVNGIVAELIV
jgi:hypothetical protein